MKILDKIFALWDKKIVSTKEYEAIQKYRISRSDLKSTVDDYNALLNFLLENASVRILKELLAAKEIDTIPAQKDELKYAVRAAYSKEFKKS